MRKALTVLFLCLCGLSAFAQANPYPYITVTGTKAAYANGTITANFINRGSKTPGIRQQTAIVSPTGTFAITAWNNSYFDYVSSADSFTICMPSPTAYVCSTTTDLVLTANTDISSYLASAPNATISALSGAIRTITANDTGTTSDFTVLCNASSAAVTESLPATPTTGQIFNFKKIDASTNACMLSGNGKNIDQATSLNMTTQDTNYELQFDGTQWWII